jgi:hypothetical protein
VLPMYKCGTTIAVHLLETLPCGAGGYSELLPMGFIDLHRRLYASMAIDAALQSLAHATVGGRISSDGSHYE